MMLASVAPDPNLFNVHVPLFFDTGGIGEAVAAALAGESGLTVQMLAVREIPRSGPGDDLLDLYGISAKQIVKTVKAM